jgi:hypothetical protein
MDRDDVYPARTSKVGSLLNYVIAYLVLNRLIVDDTLISTGPDRTNDEGKAWMTEENNFDSH